ncbi:MAG: NYN domain-containing protein [Nitrospirota bacterium]|nr:NYN domain-containing protein [Nitrospirota bacterium]
MAHILIDAYNLIAKMEGISGNLEPQRERFIRKLSEYRMQKGHIVTVVFDGEKGGWATESHERTLGINIVFSRLGEKADDVIKRIVRGHEEEYTVITSDKEVASFAETWGHTAIPSEEFIPKLCYGYDKGTGAYKDDEEDDGNQVVTTRKKGNPNKLSKAARRRKQRLDRL